MTEHTHKQPMRAHRIYENAAALGACEAERDRLKALNAELVSTLVTLEPYFEPESDEHKLIRASLLKAKRETT